MNKLFAICILFFSGSIYAQELSVVPFAYNAASIDFENGTDIQINSSIGELFVQTNIDSSIKITEGFHQGRIINIHSGVTEELSRTLRLKMYPNPIQNDLYINLEYSSDALQLSASIYDLYGRRIDDINGGQLLYPGSTYRYDFSALPDGQYFVKFFNVKGNYYSQYALVKVN